MRLRSLSLPFILSLSAGILPLNSFAAERIVTVGGDVTEIVYALGAGGEIVARDSTSLQPQAVQKLPDVGYMRMLNAEGILAMKPTMLLASELMQPSLVLKQVADSGVNVVTIPGQNTAADAMIRAAGGSNAMQGFSRYHPLPQEGVIASAPDLLLITSDGVRAPGGSEGIWKLPGMALTPAGKNKRLLVVDDMALPGFGLETPHVLAQLRKSMEQAQ
jgi:iron complex transport system substrate-binding protein